MSRRGDKVKRVPRKDRRGANPLTVGLLMLLLVALFVYAGFSKHVPFTHGFRVHAVFETSNNIKPNSPVRIAGVNIGKVTKIEPYEGGDGNATLVTMEIDQSGLPIHKDATLKVRPRIFLEGNEFVDLQPGTPSAPTIDDGDTIPMTQTAAPVQLDQVLTALQSDTRRDLQRLLEGYGSALTMQPTPADDRTQDPDVQGETAAQALNDSITYAPDALRGAAIVNTAFQGLERHDLSGLVAGTARFSQGLVRHEDSLKGLVTNLDTTLASLASQRDDLRRSIAELGPTLQHANSALTHLNASFPNTRAFALELIPGVEETPATIAAAYPWIAQTRKLVSASEAGGLIKQLRPATVDLAKLVDGSLTALPQADLVSQCVTHAILPTGNIKVQDGAFSSGTENYKEFWYSIVGMAGEGQNFDGNGHYIRAGVGGGGQTVRTGKYGGDGASLIGHANQPPLGTRPAYPGSTPPPHNGEAACKDQAVADVNGAKTGGVESSHPSPAGTSTSPGTTATAASALRGATTRSAKGGSSDLAQELADRLNPFRTGSAGR
ncbi:MAG TPA: MlaD family protein [Baekduia sp.]|nr:MlaD family protein [Baekduia sp.]